MSSPYRDGPTLPIRCDLQIHGSASGISQSSFRKLNWRDTIQTVGHSTSALVLVLTIVGSVLQPSRSSLRILLRELIEVSGFGPAIVLLALIIPMVVLVVSCGIVSISNGVIALDRLSRLHCLRRWPEAEAEVVAVRSLTHVLRTTHAAHASARHGSFERGDQTSDAMTQANHRADVDLRIVSADGDESLVRVGWCTPDPVTIGTRFFVRHRPGNPGDLLWLS